MDKIFRLFLGIILFISFLFNFNFVQAQADQGGFDIQNFDSKVIVNPDGSLNVTENIDVNFYESRHGIFRFIPLVAEIKHNEKIIDRILDINVISVKRNNRDEPFTATIDANTNDKLETKYFARHYNIKNIKIGDKDKLVKGRQVYTINYTVNNTLVGDQTTAILFWGVTGTGWNIPIKNSSVEVLASKDVFQSFKCFAGGVGTKDGKDCQIKDNGTATRILNASTKRTLEKGEGFNIQVEIDSRYLTIDTSKLNESSPYDDTADRIFEMIALIMSVVCLFLPIGFTFLVYLFWKKRNVNESKVLVPYYDAPDGLKPAQVGLIYDENVDTIDISSTIIDLARRGYLKIRNNHTKGFLGIGDTNDYILVSQNKAITDLEPFEQRIYNGVFASGSEVSLSSLQNKFYKNISSINSDIQTWAVSSGYFTKKALGRGGRWGIVIAIVLLAGVSIFCNLFFFTHFALTCAYWLIAFTCIGINAYFIFTLNYRTLKGADIKNKILGLKQYISLAEKERINMLNSPEQTVELFEKLLPYAIIFKQHVAWAQKFEGIYKEPPSWYEDNWSTFNTLYFVNSLYNANTTLNTTLSSNPSQSGSGFSGGGFGGSVGGGFGGGGGGSW